MALRMMLTMRRGVGEGDDDAAGYRDDNDGNDNHDKRDDGGEDVLDSKCNEDNADNDDRADNDVDNEDAMTEAKMILIPITAIVSTTSMMAT